jgi:hypothetical protein
MERLRPEVTAFRPPGQEAMRELFSKRLPSGMRRVLRRSRVAKQPPVHVVPTSTHALVVAGYDSGILSIALSRRGMPVDALYPEATEEARMNVTASTAPRTHPIFFHQSGPLQTVIGKYSLVSLNLAQNAALLSGPKSMEEEGRELAHLPDIMRPGGVLVVTFPIVAIDSDAHLLVSVVRDRSGSELQVDTFVNRALPALGFDLTETRRDETLRGESSGYVIQSGFTVARRR